MITLLPFSHDVDDGVGDDDDDDLCMSEHARNLWTSRFRSKLSTFYFVWLPAFNFFAKFTYT